MADHGLSIELEIHGRPERGDLVPLRTFARATDNLTNLLSQVAADRPDHVRIDWFVSDLRKGSTILSVEGLSSTEDVNDSVSEVMRTTVDAMEMVERGEDIRGMLSYPAVEKLRALANVVNDGAAGMLMRGFGREVQITGTAADHARALLARRLRSFGSVEGKVETISVHEPRPYFNVFHALDGYAIKCRCDGAILSQVKESLGARIRVTGTIMRRFDGRAESVDVSDVRILRRKNLLAQVSEIRGINVDNDGPLSERGQQNVHG